MIMKGVIKMEKPEGIITENDKVYDVVTAHPRLKEVLKEISPKFVKLNNPVVFNTVAKVTSLKMAAKIGDVYLKEMLYRLNEAIGKGSEYMAWFKSQIPAMQEEFMKKQFGSETEGGEKPLWVSAAKDYETIDARKLGEEPFPIVVAKAGTIKAGSGFILIQSFKPSPLIHYLETQGFESWTEKLSENEYRVFFMKKKGG
jgi:hypothetical protein